MDNWFLLNACLWSPPDPHPIYLGSLAINSMVTSSTNTVQADTSDTLFMNWEYTETYDHFFTSTQKKFKEISDSFARIHLLGVNTKESDHDHALYPQLPCLLP
eukprot:8711072-Ditylum_brightwellii.AAC.1